MWWLGRVREREEEKARARREEVEREERETERRAEHAAREERAFRRVEEMKAEEERLRRGRVEEERLRRGKVMEERRRSVENWLVEDARLRDEEARQEVIRCLSDREDESVSEERVRKERVRVEEGVRLVEERREKERVRQQQRTLEEERRVVEERVREEEEAEVREEAWCQSRREEAASTRIGAISRGIIARRHVSALGMEREEREKMEALTREEAATLLCAASRGMLARLACRRRRWEEGLERLFSEAARVVCFAARRWLGVVRRRERVRAASLIRDVWRRVREERRERKREKDREESREEERREARREEEAARAREEEAARENAARVACEAAAEARRRQEEVERWKAEAAQLLRLEQRRVEEEARALEVRREAELARIRLERQAAAARRKEVRAQHTIRTCWKTFVLNRKKEPAAVQIQACYRGWVQRERGWHVLIGKSHFDFPRRLEDIRLTFQHGARGTLQIRCACPHACHTQSTAHSNTHPRMQAFRHEPAGWLPPPLCFLDPSSLRDAFPPEGGRHAAGSDRSNPPHMDFAVRAAGCTSLSAKSRADLSFVIATLKAQRHLKVRVVGTCKHTEVPIVAKRRAHSISDYLLEHGVLKRQLRSEAVLPASIGGLRSYGASDVTPPAR